jgi:hypothetical protein
MKAVVLPAITATSTSFIGATDRITEKLTRGSSVKLVATLTGGASVDVPSVLVVHWHRAGNRSAQQPPVASRSTHVKRQDNSGTAEILFTVPREPGQYDIEVFQGSKEKRRTIRFPVTVV